MAVGQWVNDYSYRREPQANPSELIKQWREREGVDGRVLEAQAVVFTSEGCFWFSNSGCTFCGYFNDLADKVDDDNIWSQFESINLEGADIVKLYTSGSFLDQREVSQAMQFKILEALKEKEQVVIETRVEFCTDKVLGPLAQFNNIQLAIGLEIADDEILQRSVNKGITTEGYLSAVAKAREYGFGVRTYLLCKPILLNEQQALEAAVKSIEFAAPHSDVISLNPLYVHRNTLTEFLFKRNEYRPPRMWTLVQILRQTAHLLDQTRIICDPTAGGTRRGAHNCRNCNKYVAAAIEHFSHHQEPSSLEEVWKHGCECQAAYETNLEMEKYSFASSGLMP